MAQQQQQQQQEEERMVKLQSSDNEDFEVKESVISQAVTIKNMIEDTGIDCKIQLPNVKSQPLAKVLEYLNYHHENPNIGDDKEKKQEIKAWDKEFVNMPKGDLFDVIMAANFMNINSLLDITCQAVAGMITGKTPEQIRETFGIVNDFTPEEEAELRKEQLWESS